ncbi:hypothetical protein BN1708_001306 [Verticillium longisporum]|uniref:Calcineurin subunit B n=6 Tax=Verticillium TaxID=1036719 RepID=A0A0G4MNL1_VERLO|nr:hypothetical protein BN1708_001306 [Verticillium longisporum]
MAQVINNGLLCSPVHFLRMKKGVCDADSMAVVALADEVTLGMFCRAKNFRWVPVARTSCLGEGLRAATCTLARNSHSSLRKPGHPTRLATSTLDIMGNTTSAVLDNIVQGSNFDRDEVDRLRKRFMKLDKDNSGTIERDEFLSLPQISSNPLATRMIAIFDEDGGGDVDFQEFVSGLSAFSSKGNKEQKLRFAFKVYDIDRDGFISNGELFIVLKMMVGSNLKDQQLQQIVDKTIMEADLDNDGKISFDEFTKMVENTDVSMSMTLDQF